MANTTRRNFLIATGGLTAAVVIYELVSKDDDPASPSYRQSKLEQMIKDKRISQMYKPHVESITYDLGFKAHLAYLQKELEQARKNGNMQEIKRFERSIGTNKRYAKINENATTSTHPEIYAITGVGYDEHKDEPQMKSTVFVTERFFDTPREYTEEDRMCILYHEGLHVMRNAGLERPERIKWVEWLRKKMGRQSVPPEVNNDPKLSDAFHELVALNDELENINKGTFKVSRKYLTDTLSGYTKRHAILQQYAKHDNVKGWCAQAVLNMAAEPLKE